ncbi:MAG: hypothetical protein AAGJ32_05430 [Pseudomonadota bacterium]
MQLTDPKTTIPPPMQYAFDFSSIEPSFGDLVIGPANRQAVDQIQSTETWPLPWLCLVGPERSGRSTLAAAWAYRYNGEVIGPQAFNAAPLAELDAFARRATALDDADTGLDDDRLLHLLNQARSNGARVLLTAAASPIAWTARQPDLVSRLKAMTVAHLDLPGESMVRDLIETACHARHVGLPDDVWTYLEKRVPRDYAAIETLALELCAAVSGTGRSLTVPIAREVLGDTGDLGEDGEEADE